MHVYECVWERPHACHSYQGIPLGASGGEECHNKPKFVAHKHRTVSPIGVANVRHIWIFQISMESKADGGEKPRWTGIKRNTQNAMIVTSPLIFLPSAHRVLAGCICIGSEEMHQAFKHGWSSLRRTALLPVWKDIFAVVYKPHFLLPPRAEAVFITCVLVCGGSGRRGHFSAKKSITGQKSRKLLITALLLFRCYKITISEPIITLILAVSRFFMHKTFSAVSQQMLFSSLREKNKEWNLK